MAGAKKLVIGASGFLGSHVTRQLVDRGDDVRVLVRRTSSTKAIEDLNVEYHYGDIFDDAALRAAMAGCDDVFYCVVDTRAWLRDPAPLFRTNVEGLRHVLDAAVDADLRRFVFTSTIGTIGIPAVAAPRHRRGPVQLGGQGRRLHPVACRGREPRDALCAGSRAARRSAVCLEHVRARRLATDAARQAARDRRRGQVAFLRQGLDGRSSRCRGCRRRADPRRGKGPKRRALHHLRAVHERSRAVRDGG